ncbi:MAG: alanine--tRNA ligase [Bacilli bacterium]
MKKMTSNEIRTMFINFFKEKDHLFMESSSLIPQDDSSLLWVNAGVTPLKKFFDGREVPPKKRIVTVQKCMRTNDIENVGKTARHHTFFEMLGNFSLGDYFKKEALSFAYELLTDQKYFGFDKDKLYITVYPNDQEAYNIWLSLGIDPTHIIKLKSNYWEIGEGPCGPDSEIFYDRGEEFDPDKKGLKLLEEEIPNDRYLEIWNNVFSQFNAKSNKNREDYPELPNKNIDTGMGLERMASILQDVPTNYETDLFMPIIKEVSKITNYLYSGESSFKIIADHLRTLTFALSDGALFANEGRGYVLRRLLRRAVLQGRKLGMETSFLYKIVDVVVEIMSDVYPNLLKEKERVKKLIKKEEELFYKTLLSGEKRLEEIIKKSKTKFIAGEDAFKLYDTYGFPLELTKEVLEEKGFVVRKEDFDIYMKKQQDRARQARKKEGSMESQNKALIEFKEKSLFVGYDTYSLKTKVIGLIRDEENVLELSDQGYVILEKTPFFAEMGGQVADTGFIEGEGFQAEVLNVIRIFNKQHAHFVRIKKGTIKLKDKVTANIDIKRREKITKNHSATHLLQEALREALDKNIVQAGSRVDENTLRFDFSYPYEIKDEDIIIAEHLVNEKLKTKVDTIIEEMTLDEATGRGALALFSEKYDDIVRTVTLYDSFELCGGTHVQNIGDINKFAIKSIESKGLNVYRIEAVTDENIEEKLYEVIKPYNEEMKKLLNKSKRIVEEAYLNDIELTFNVFIDHEKPTSYQDIVYNRNEVEEVRRKVKELEKEYIRAKESKVLSDLSFFDQYIEKNKIGEYIVLKVEDYDLKILKQIVDQLIERLDKGFVFLANVSNNNVNFIAKCNKSIAEKVNCGDYIKAASLKAKGNGGGSKTFGQGGGTDITVLEEILLKVKEKINKLS